MHTHPHSHPTHPHLKHLSHRLQNEVDSILNSVNDASIHAEFKDSEVVNIDSEIEEDVLREALDARIQGNMKKRSARHTIFPNKTHTSHHTLHKHPVHTHTALQAQAKLKKFLDLLFKRFEI